MENTYNPLYVKYNNFSPKVERKVVKDNTLLSEFIYQYINKNNRPVSYKRAYLNLVSHLNKFCKLYDVSFPYTNSVDMEFCEGFLNYLKTDVGLMQNTARGMIEKLSSILRKAVLHGYPINNTFSEIKIQKEESNPIYLDQTEIVRLYYFNGLTKFQENIRDLFIIGCCTGLRYSDYSRLSDNNFVNYGTQIQIKTKKTSAIVQLPIHRFVREIYEKYGNKMPKSHSIQYFDRYIKLICKKAGFTDNILWERTVGNNIVRKTLKRYELISSHTARRSFATNAFLSGIPPYRIMLITGHKSEKSFFRYIRITREENALSLSSHKFFQ